MYSEKTIDNNYIITYNTTHRKNNAENEHERN